MGMGTMRSDQNYVHWHQSLEKLKEEWAEFTKELFSALPEEMSSREELGNCHGLNSRPGAAWHPPQKRGGQDE
jgi:hypothetical protein